MSEVTVVRMPAMGDEGDTITLDRWIVQIGAHVQVGAPLCSVSIDKVDTEVPSPVAGYVTRFLVRPHEGEISVGQPLLEIAAELPASLDLAQVHRDQSLDATPLVIPAVLLDPMAQLPRQGSDLAAGWDLHAVEDVTLPSRGWGAVRTGVAIALPAGYEMQIRPRSGLAARHGVTVLNAPGTIDADYRGELKVLLINHGAEDYAIRAGDRIAQAVVARHETLRFVCTDALPATDRGDGGFGHTGR